MEEPPEELPPEESPPLLGLGVLPPIGAGAGAGLTTGSVVGYTGEGVGVGVLPPITAGAGAGVIEGIGVGVLPPIGAGAGAGVTAGVGVGVLPPIGAGAGAGLIVSTGSVQPIILWNSLKFIDPFSSRSYFLIISLSSSGVRGLRIAFITASSSLTLI